MKIFRAMEREAADKLKAQQAAAQPPAPAPRWSRAELVAKLREEAHFAAHASQRDVMRAAAEMLDRDAS